MLDQLTFEKMKPHVGSVFRADVGGRVVDLKLVDAGKVMESEAARLARTPFSLYFAGPPEPYLQQSIYPLRHEAFSEPLEIFMVPVERTKDGFTYEAVFT